MGHWPLIAMGVGGVVLIATVLGEAFETMILPRRLNRRFRFTGAYFRGLWPIWSGVATRLRNRRRREAVLSAFGPFSMLLLFVLWALVLVLGFALLYRSLGWPQPPGGRLGGVGRDIYLSGSLLSTLGFGAGAPQAPLSRMLGVAEGGLGLGFVALIISYLPVLYTSFSQRESNITMLDARAGSPPTASELLRRHAGDLQRLESYLAEWERWSAQLLESHISYPVLGYFRSQHVNQSWLAALTSLLDACALLLASSEEACVRQAEHTFAAARHAVVDLAQIFFHDLPAHAPDRLPPGDWDALHALLALAGWRLRQDAASASRLADLRRMYEPHIGAIAAYLKLETPRWIGDPDQPDNWQRSPWGTPSAWLGRLMGPPQDKHF